MSPTENVTDQSGPISTQDLQELGKMMVAYIRPAVSEGISGFAIHGADGAVIGFAADRLNAIGAIREHGMEFVSVH